MRYRMVVDRTIDRTNAAAMSQDPTSADARALEMRIQGHWSYRTLHDYFVDVVQSAPDSTALQVHGTPVDSLPSSPVARCASATAP